METASKTKQTRWKPLPKNMLSPALYINFLNSLLETSCVSATPSAPNQQVQKTPQEGLCGKRAKAARKFVTLSLTSRGMEPGHLLHSAITCPPSRNHGMSNQDTHLYPLHSKSSVHLTATTEVRRSGQIIDRMRSSRRALRDSYFHPRYRHPPS